MMMTEMDIETSVYNVHLTRLIAREDFIKFTRRESTKTYIDRNRVGGSEGWSGAIDWTTARCKGGSSPFLASRSWIGCWPLNSKINGGGGGLYGRRSK
jgi:hypothetical protein